MMVTPKFSRRERDSQGDHEPREVKLTERERALVREFIKEQKLHFGITDPAQSRAMHEWWAANRELLDQVLPWVSSQKEVADAKLKFWTGARADLLKWVVVDGGKILVLFILLCILY